MLFPLHFYTKTFPFTPLWYGGPSPFTHTLHGSLRPPRALSLLCKTAPLYHRAIPDVTCIILVQTTNTADKITTTPLLDSTLSPRPPPVDHRGDPLSHTFNID